MSLFQNHYLREVLGITRYIPSEVLLKQRVLKRRWPCKILIVVSRPPLPEEKSLLYKMMKSISVSDFSILEVKPGVEMDSSLEQALKQGEVCYLICFGNILRKTLEGSFVAPSLDQFLGTSAQVRQNKQKMWQALQKIKKELVNDF